MNAKLKGFTLIEIGIALLIVSFVTLLGLSFLKLLNVQKKRNEVKTAFLQAEKALKAYVMVHNRLPCPDVNGDWREDGPPGTCSCTPPNCFLPYNTLGITPPVGADPSNPSSNVLRYYVAPDLTRNFDDLTSFCTVLREYQEFASTGAGDVVVEVCLNPPSCTQTRKLVALLLHNYEGQLRGDNADNDFMFERSNRPYSSCTDNPSNCYDDWTYEIPPAEFASDFCGVSGIGIEATTSRTYDFDSGCADSKTVNSGNFTFPGTKENLYDCSAGPGTLVATLTQLLECDWRNACPVGFSQGTPRDGRVNW